MFGEKRRRVSGLEKVGGGGVFYWPATYKAMISTCLIELPLLRYFILSFN